jgi:hypothetical protein
VDSIWLRLRLRLLPALLTAIGVSLLASGLLSFTSAVEQPPDARALPSYAPLPSIDPGLVLPGATSEPEASPTFPAGRVATRVVIRRLDIDLPVLLQPEDVGLFPLCDVALYLPELGQPGEGRATYIYAHARTGMFLPLLTASLHNNGARMLGMTVQVYTSDNWLFLYTITEVRRHQHSLNDAFDTTFERLFLQTSEGINNSFPKLQVVADYLSSEPTDPAAAHPKAHPKICH